MSIKTESYVRLGLAMLGEMIAQKTGTNPTANTGSEFVCPEFELRAYNWDEEAEELPNFKCGDYEVTWYKYLGRITESNQYLGPTQWNDIFEKCKKALDEY